MINSLAWDFLRSYALTPAEGRDGFVLTFRPGDRFKADYRTFYTRRSPGEVRFTFHDENREIGDPHRVAYLFMEKRTGRKPDATAYVSSKDVETAKELLAHLSMAQIPDFLDYALARGREDPVRPADPWRGPAVPQRIPASPRAPRLQPGRQPTPGNRSSVRPSCAWITTSTAAPRPSGCSTGFLPTSRPTIEALARAKLSAGGPVSGFMAPTLIRVEKLRLTIERHPARLPTSTSGQHPAQLKTHKFPACALTEIVCGLTEQGVWFDRKNVWFDRKLGTPR